MNIQSAVIAAVAMTLVTSSLSGQGIETPSADAAKPHWELLAPSGTIIPTGTQRGAIKRGNLSAAQVTYVPRSALAITTMFGWARSRDLAIAGSPKLDVFTYDVGAEVRAPRWKTAGAMTFTPFAGAGVGGRSYNHRSLDVDATHNVAAYGSVGGELGIRRVRVRLEARDYVTGFKQLSGNGAARTGNDVVVMAGLRIVSR